MYSAETTPTSTSTAKMSTSSAYQPWWPSHGNVACLETAPIIAITIVGPSTRKPQKMNAWIRPGTEPLQQLALTKHDRRLVAHAPLEPAAAVDRRARADQRDEKPDAVHEQRPAHPEGEAERDCPGRDAYEPLTFLTRSLIAGTTSCRSPITP